MIKLFRVWLVLVLIFLGVMSLFASGSSPPYGDARFFVVPEDETATGTCSGDTFIVTWQVLEGDSPTLSAVPSGNVEPRLSQTEVEREGRLLVTVRDDAELFLDVYNGTELSLTIIDTAKITIPDSICTGFPTDLRGGYRGTLEQITPQAASLPHQLNVYWDGDREALVAILVRADIPVVEMICTPFDAEDNLTCVGDPPGEVFWRLEGTVTERGYEGSYQGVLEGATFQTSTSGTFTFIKQ
jgi:hypothetical protein